MVICNFFSDLTVLFIFSLYLLVDSKATRARVSKAATVWLQHFSAYASKFSKPISVSLWGIATFRSAQKANVSILFAFLATIIILGAGASIDLTRAYMAREKLVETATLACQYAERPNIVGTSATSYSGSSGGAIYISAVNAFITSTLAAQHIQYTQTTAIPFSYIPGGAANVTLTASVPTAFMKIINVAQMPVGATSHCYNNIASIPQHVASSGSAFLLQEGFENGSTTMPTDYILPTGVNGSQSSPNNSFTSTVGYTGVTGTQWYIMGYCLEIDLVGQILSTVPQGTHSAELDCENGSHSAGNSSISAKTYLAAGNYELRYNTASRVDYPSYDPVYLCGSAASDLSWANDTNSSGWSVTNALRTNQINVYFDLNSNGTPPTHTTIDGSQTLGGSNLIDMCVYSNSWIERSVRIKVTTAGYYWLSFAADGKSDSYGGQIDNIRLCVATCTTSLQDNFPSTWVASNGANVALFEDNFEAPVYSGTPYNNNGNMYNSNGTSGSSSGWPSQTASGWAMGAANQLPYWTATCPQGNQCVELGWTSNSFISRPFLLDPGYYQVSYDYVPEISFSSLSGVYCGSTPNAANISSLTGAANQYGTIRYYNTQTGAKTSLATNIVGVFMAHAQLVSTANLNSTLGATTQYTNPNGTTSTTPAVAPNSISLSSYNSAQNNPLLDICGYAASPQLTRTAYVSIQKPAYYWLTLSALSSNGYGGFVDDVKLTSLGSPYMSSPPSSYVTIPVPTPQPGAATTFTGFEIISDPLTPPAALQ